jgi:glycerol uptake facilitator-like aquaporin
MLGTALLLATVVGSGVMAERLAGGNVVLALLGNTLATGAILAVLITVLGPISGAHFNPVVSVTAILDGGLRRREALAYTAAQLAGAIPGVLLAHAMFAEPIVQVSTRLRAGPAQMLSEFVATFGLVLAIQGTVRFRPQAVPAIVGLYISAAYWFTASTSFANPAVTVARSLSDTFSGIAPASAPGFILAQFAGGLAGLYCWRWLAPVTPSAASS